MIILLAFFPKINHKFRSLSLGPHRQPKTILIFPVGEQESWTPDSVPGASHTERKTGTVRNN